MSASILLAIFVDGGIRIEASLAINFLLSASAFWLAWKWHSAKASLILGAQFLVIPTYLAYSSLGTFDSSMLVYPAGVIAISVVAQPKSAVIFSTLTMLCVGFLGLATFKGWNGDHVLSSIIATNPIDIIASTVLLGFSAVVAVYVSTLLTGLLRTLANHQDQLEERIRKRTAELEKANFELTLAVKRLDDARVELVRGEKLAGLGSLVAGVAHELNTPIGNVTVSATSLQGYALDFKKLSDSGVLRKSELNAFLSRCLEGIDLIISSTKRAADLVTSFKLVAVDQTSERRRKFELDQVINDVAKSMRPGFRGHAWTLNCIVEPNLICDSYPGPLGQVLSNLIQNAVFHGFQGRESGTINISAKRLDDQNVQIVVQDDGCGIPPDTISRIFDPFFTTRMGQGGSGLGLTIVHNLVTGTLLGKIAVESAVDQGTSFVLTIPTTVGHATEV